MLNLKKPAENTDSPVIEITDNLTGPDCCSCSLGDILVDINS